MGWQWTGDKPLPEPMLTQFMDAHMHHQGPFLLTQISFNLMNK